MQRTETIAKIAYNTLIKDLSFLKKFIDLGKFSYAKTQPEKSSVKIGDETSSQSESGRPVTFRSPLHNAKPAKIWEKNKDISDTSRRYSRPYVHMGLWSRIAGNSGGSLPRQVEFVADDAIEQIDGSTIQSYLTPSRGIRKCFFSVFCACAKDAAISIGLFEGCKKRPYRCIPVGLSVKSLSKDTHAGTDTMGRKNNLDVQRRVIDQVKDVFKRPTSRKVLRFDASLVYSELKLEEMFNLPEVIFHRFQAVYDSALDVCKEKCRIVWCIPYTILSIENVFFYEAINSVLRHSLLDSQAVYPIGLTNYQIGQRSVKTLRESFKVIGNENNKIYSLDFSKFDSTIPLWAKDIFFAIMETTLELKPKEKLVFNFLRIYVKYTPFLIGKEVKVKQKGISSGLLITNLFDTWWNLTLHNFVECIQCDYPELIPEILSEDFCFSKNYINKERVIHSRLNSIPLTRVMGDDTLILCSEETLILHRKICLALGMTVSIKNVSNSPEDDIFFLGRFWNEDNRPFQSEQHIALRIVYTKWYNDKKIPFDLKDLHLNRMLSICLPFVNGKEFLDKYLFDYQPYADFMKSDKGFTYIKEFIEDNFRYVERDDMLDVDTY